MKFTIAIIHELSPAVGCSGQEVIDTLIILHQEREHVLILDLIFYKPLELQHLQIVCVELQAVILVSGMTVFLKFGGQNLRKPFPNKGAAGILQSKYLVRAVDLQLQVYGVRVALGDNLMHIEIFSYQELARTEADLLVLKYFETSPWYSYPVISSIHGYTDVCKDLRGTIHLHVDVKPRKAKQIIIAVKFVLGSPYRRFKNYVIFQVLFCIFIILPVDCQF